ncbi:MAG TPA: kinase/pyrophosphorylase, partial [Hyphomicrobium sp.]|nr:kinase/pyrophosphorylase [Hyphomicrobium sp.]
LTIQPDRLHQVRSERRPNSTYASIENCRHEIREAEKMMRAEGIHWLDSSTRSIEEISAKVMQAIRIERSEP